MSLIMVTRQKIYILNTKISFGKHVWLLPSKTFNKLETLLLKAVPQELEKWKRVEAKSSESRPSIDEEASR
jgi:hypothetical protein